MRQPPKYLTTPEEQEAWREKRREYMRDYLREYCKRPECVAKKREYEATLDAKVKRRKSKATPAVRAVARAYEAIPEVYAKRRDYFRKYRNTPEGKAKIKETSREYAATPKIKAKRQKQRATPEARERMRDYMKGHRATPSGRATIIAKEGQRRAIKQAAPVGDVKEIRTWVKHWKSLPVVFCHWCEGAFYPSRCHADHIMPLARGGAHSRNNMVIACATCNLRKNAKHPDEWVKELEAVA